MRKKILYFVVKIISTLAPNYMARKAVEKACAPRRFERTEQENECFKRGNQITFASGRIANIWGENGDPEQPLILLIHGWESRGTAFYAIIDALVDKGFKALAWNAPAHGASPGDKTQIYAMAAALLADLKQMHFVPAAIIGHSMGGAMISLLDKYTLLPNSIVIISAPTFVDGIFRKTFKKYGMSGRSVESSLQRISAMGDYSMNEASLINSQLYKQRSVLVVHDENDREIPFSEFENLKPIWNTATFHATQGLGHRRIIRDEKLAKYIANFIKT